MRDRVRVLRQLPSRLHFFQLISAGILKGLQQAAGAVVAQPHSQ
jgi:hypothetical protein